MPYENWSTQQNILSILRVYRINTINFCLQQLREDIVNRRLQNESIRFTTPKFLSITETERIPNNEQFVCDGIGAWCIYFDKLGLTIRAMVRMGVELEESRSLPQLEEQALEQIHKIIGLLYNLDHVLTRDDIEKKYGMKWFDLKAGPDVLSRNRKSLKGLSLSEIDSIVRGEIDKIICD